MARNLQSWSVLVIFAVAAVCLISAVDAGGELGLQVGWMPAESEGLGGEFEFAMESEISRRILATRKYISYGALQKNSVPCSRRGASYYNCKPGAQANPYSRGCSSISRCRR